MRKIFVIFLLFLALPAFCEDKHPDFAQMYLGKDKFENFNRKVFKLNSNLNKYAIRPVTVIWSSIMPKYGMERIKAVYSNALFPKYLISSIAQGDFKAAGRASVRFLTNSTVGLGGMFDPAKKFLKIKPVNENMEQALAKYKMKQGPYLVVPFFNSSTPRGLLGRALDSALDPSSYVGSPVIAAVKAGFMLNDATMGQPLIKNLEKNFIDPYDIAKKLYGLQVAILTSNLDRDEVLEEKTKEILIGENNSFIEVSEVETPVQEVIRGSATTDEIIDKDDLIPDIILENFNPQHPVTDAMRTALFEIEGVNKSIWGELSLWNMSFQNRIKTDEVQIFPNRQNYKFRYIMQKDKTSPLAIIFPSIGEGVNSYHSTLFAKMFYDKGYSVVIEGSAFHYDFVKSMPKEYKPGIPTEDAPYIQKTTNKIVKKLENKYSCKFKDKVVLGTSFGGISALFLGELESRNGVLNISKYISICPPVELFYAMNSIDKTSEDWDKNPELKEKTTLTAAKILKAKDEKEEGANFESLPFNLEESKLITGFVLHQKLSDLIFAIEEVPLDKKTDFYEKIKNISYGDYAKKYLITEKYPNMESFTKISTLHSIQNFLKENNNYRIYHSMDDYMTNLDQLKQLKKYSKSKMKLVDKGSHLGFLYRNEFLEDLKSEISIKAGL